MISNLEYFKVFYYTAKSGSVTGAAALLSISQPAVSQSLKQLEKNLGVSLFCRAARGVKLTAEGELLYSYVSKGYEQIELGVDKVRQMQAQLLRISQSYPAIPRITPDGIFGQATENALKGCQRRFGLTADGVCGCASWKKIAEATVGIGRTATVIDK